jgi:hypothetical protein
MTSHDNHDGFLDDEWGKKRPINSEKIAINEHNKSKKQSIKTSNERTKKRIDPSVKYGKNKGEISGHKPLSIPDQIRIAAGLKQAVVKVTSYGKGSAYIMNHLTYISRNFDIPLEDNNQSLLKTKDDAANLLESWESIFFDGRKNSRDTVHLIFSTPPGTNRDTFKTLTREFLSEEFEGEHDYVFAQHDDTEHPHIHSVIVMRSTNGKKLDPRKQYINQLRKRYAEKCREHGVMVEASRRFERGIAGKSTRFEMVQMRNKKQITPAADEKLMDIVKTEIQSGKGRVDTGQAIRETRNTEIRALFYNSAKSLYQGYMQAPEGARKEKDLKAAQLLFDYSKGMPNEVTRAEYLRHLVESNRAGRLIDKGDQSRFLDVKKDKWIDLDVD